MPPLRILFVAPYIPSLLRVRAYNLITHLSANGHRVTVLALRRSKADEQDATELRRYCERVETIHVPLRRSLWNCLRGAVSQLPLQALFCDAPAMHAQLHDALRGGSAGARGSRNGGRQQFDVLHVEHLRAVLFGLNVSGIPRVYDSVDCISRLFEQTVRMGATPASRLRAFVDLERTRRFEAELAARFDRTLIASQRDKEALQELARRLPPSGAGDCSDAISVLPGGVDIEYFRPTGTPREPATLVYVGRMAYHANVSAVMDFAQAVLPRIWSARPDVKFLIVGAQPSREIHALARRHGERVCVTGYVPDVRPYLARATVSVSPLVYAAGIQNKVLQAMAMGTPVVTTAPGTAALRARHGEHLLVARDAVDFASQVVRVLGDPDLQRRIGGGGRRYVETHHDWRQIVKQLQTVYHDVTRAGRAADTGEMVRRHVGSY